jgi:hypothetical protein
MIHKASGRAALILAVGLGVGFAVPSWAADPQTDAAAVTAPANPADAQAAPANQAVGADQQLSDADRAARQDDVRAPVVVTQAQTQTETPAQATRANPVAAGSQNATWDETSLIGKIFIGFGALLTVASAARMFMA